jgi:general secretion pathway protein A
VVLTGDAGTGKTTLLSSVISRLPADQVQSSILLNPILTPSEFLEFVLLDFGIASVPASKAQRLWQLQEFLLRTYRENRIAILIIDEAHKLGLDVLEEIRLLGNFEYGADKFLQIVLLGQCELDDLLNRQDLRQFKQRVALRLYIDPLPAPEVGQFIRFRWRKAGGTEIPFTPEALDGIAGFSRGIPRVVNSLCDTALLTTYGEGRRLVSARDISEAAANLGLAGTPVAATVLPQPDTATPLPAEQYRSRGAPPSITPAPSSAFREEYDLPGFAAYGASRKNSTLLKFLARKFVQHKGEL